MMRTPKSACIGSAAVDSSTLLALSPLDGRYARKAAPLRQYLSEYALIRYRVLIEVRWLQRLADEPSIASSRRSNSPRQGRAERHRRRVQHRRRAAGQRAVEAKTNHDVKAVEYLLRAEARRHAGRVGATSTAFMHFACTSEDINNLAYALMLRDARQRVLLPPMKQLAIDLRTLAHALRRRADARAHARPARDAHDARQGDRELRVPPRAASRPSTRTSTICGKFNGAVGNFNAHALLIPRPTGPRISRPLPRVARARVDAVHDADRAARLDRRVLPGVVALQYGR